MTDKVTLTPREAVVDAFHRCLQGIDNNDHALFESACLTNETMAIVAGSTTLDGWTAINEFFERLFALVTSHMTSNIRVQMEDGADTASLTAHALAHHIRPEDAFKAEDTSYTASSLYFLNLVRDGRDGLWKIKKWEIKAQWTTGDINILHG
ncbi:uncharacterized protein N7515_002097 [Penicillium bovifimosum]|uniref:SnoaL-like domain-containing protein n=1 Tax=Penicillium bovifimosum TaxID=126998 RepID=A0A9W9L7R6_9EURO|nr:uncharacterized protein N7515_002097 [Penicillium bovifimosum]KAJ5143310.1 hypothetical protein N7515_002097 [Penicillium bovifimosum]